MNNDTKQRQIEHEIMELEDRLAHKKEQLEQLNRINTNGRYFLDEGGGVRELIPPVNILDKAMHLKQSKTRKKNATDERYYMSLTNSKTNVMTVGRLIGKILTCLNILRRLIVMDI